MWSPEVPRLLPTGFHIPYPEILNVRGQKDDLRESSNNLEC